MARVKSAVAREGIQDEEEAASNTPYGGGGQPAQDVVRVSDMDGEINFSAPRGQQVAHMHPFRGSCPLGSFVKKAVAWLRLA
jgi:hypothetical protein